MPNSNLKFSFVSNFYSENALCFKNVWHGYTVFLILKLKRNEMRDRGVFSPPFELQILKLIVRSY